MATVSLSCDSPTMMMSGSARRKARMTRTKSIPALLLDHQGQPVAPDSGKIRHRDIWDLAWLSTRGAKLNPQLVLAKIGDYGVADYPALLERAIERIPQIVKSREFKAQMTRFIDSATVAKTLANDT